MINAEGVCWCGQRWDGEKMCVPDLPHAQAGQGTPAAGISEKPPVTSND